MGLVVFIAEQSVRDFAKQILQETLGGTAALGVIDNAFKGLNFRLSGLIRHLTKHRVKKVHSTEGTSDNWVDATSGALNVHSGVTANMGENLRLSKFDQT